jgi:predicted O-methyltransferase YrrM
MELRAGKEARRWKIAGVSPLIALHPTIQSHSDDSGPAFAKPTSGRGGTAVSNFGGKFYGTFRPASEDPRKTAQLLIASAPLSGPKEDNIVLRAGSNSRVRATLALENAGSVPPLFIQMKVPCMMYTFPACAQLILWHTKILGRTNCLIQPPPDLEKVIDEAWRATKDVPGFLGENEARFLGLVAACVPAQGLIVEIGSFKGRSTVMLAKVASHYGSGPIISIDPHTHALTAKTDTESHPSTYDAFLTSIRTAGVEQHVEIHRAFSKDVSAAWNRPIRFLWIDGDHTYEGAKQDFDGFISFVSPMGVVALHDALNNFPGPIRVFVEEMLRSDRFGPAGFVNSIAWSQFRPTEGAQYARERKKLEHRAARLIPFTQKNQELHGWSKIRYKLTRSRVPRSPISAKDLARALS